MNAYVHRGGWCVRVCMSICVCTISNMYECTARYVAVCVYMWHVHGGCECVHCVYVWHLPWFGSVGEVWPDWDLTILNEKQCETRRLD